MNKNVIATYLIETAHPLDKAAEIIAGEQSTGTFLEIPGETDEVKENHRGKVISIEALDKTKIPSLPGASTPDDFSGFFNKGLIKIEFPYINFGASIPNLMATITGNLYELEEFSGLKLVDIEIPEIFMDRYKGPKFGIKGTRDLVNVYDRPIIGTILKPNIGLKDESYRMTLRKLLSTGIDFIKDDEINGNPPFFPLEKRVEIAMEEINRAADQLGKKTMYAFNITDDLETMKKHHDLVVNAGGNCVMVCINSVGYTGVNYLRENSEIPIHGHRNQWGYMTRHPMLGLSFKVYQKLCRLVGVDHLHVNGLNSKFYDTNKTVVESVKDVLSPMYDDRDVVMPVLSSKQSARHARITYDSLQTTDIIHLAGGGIMAHPSGPEAGFQSMRQAWKAAINQIPIEEYAERHIQLKEALQKFS